MMAKKPVKSLAEKLEIGELVRITPGQPVSLRVFPLTNQCIIKKAGDMGVLVHVFPDGLVTLCLFDDQVLRVRNALLERF